MDPNTLRHHLDTLHAELGAASEVDPDSKRLLTEIMHDIRRLLERPSADVSAAIEPAAPEDDSLPDRLERIAVQFELDHPTLAASSRRLVDLLGKVGL